MKYTIEEYNSKVDSKEAQERVSIKRALRKNGIEFDNMECTPHLMELLEATPTARVEFNKSSTFTSDGGCYCKKCKKIKDYDGDDCECTYKFPLKECEINDSRRQKWK